MATNTITYPELTFRVASNAEPRAKEFELRLRRYRPSESPTLKPVLLVHGANNGSDAFQVPNGGLAEYLCRHNFDVWLLDWRSSRWVLNRPPLSDRTFAPADVERRLFCLDRVAQEDLPLALAEIRKHTTNPIGVVGFCLGAAALSIATARGALDAFGVDSLVLMTAGLFLRGPWDTWMKSGEYVLEQSVMKDPEVRLIDPHAPDGWPKPLAEAYARWPLSLRPKDAPDWYQRLAFMYGEPYSRALVDSVLPNPGDYFGALHLGFYLEASRLLRRGHAPEVHAPAGEDPLAASVQAHFAKRKVTLISGAQDRLWHRESLDIMYDWLLRAQAPRSKQWCTKHSLANYAHNDLLWGANAPADVFSKIADALYSQVPPENGLAPRTVVNSLGTLAQTAR